MTLDRIEEAAASHGLFVMGSVENRVLLGTDADWWSVFIHSPEYRNGVAHPVDTWSKRVIGDLAQAFDASAVYPSDGPPYAPFIAWALATGRFWQSPTGMMVHDRAGLMISIRGALECGTAFNSEEDALNPCDSCADKPCVAACPVGALRADAPYDVPTCKAYLDTPPGRDCMSGGCHVRRACPVSAAFDRPQAQSAFHMKAFNP